MKKIILALFLLPLMSICAQTTTSSNVRYDIGEAHDMIVRTIDNHRIVAHSATGTHTHNFIVSELNFGSSNAFSCNLGQLFSLPDDHYVVKDMCVYDGRCYFCGVMHRPKEDRLESSIDHQGFIGYLDISNIAPSSSALNLRLVPQTDSLTRLVAYDPEANSIRTQIAAIGGGGDDNWENIPPNTPLLLEISETALPGQPIAWEYALMKVSSTEFPSERFHDICVTDGLMRIVAELENESMTPRGISNRHVIHTVKRAGFHHQYFFYSNLPYTDEASYFPRPTDTYSSSSVYSIGNPMMMCPISRDSCCLVYGTYYNTSGAGQYSLLKLDETNQISWAKTIHPQQYPYLLDLDYSPSDNTLAVLGRDNSFTNGRLFLVPLTGTGWPTYIKLHWPDGKLQSLTMYDSNKLALGATSSNNRVYHLLQNLNSCFDYAPNCLETDDDEINRATIFQSEKRNFTWAEIDNDIWIWSTSIVHPQAVPTTNTCLRR